MHAEHKDLNCHTVSALPVKIRGFSARPSSTFNHCLWLIMPAQKCTLCTEKHQREYLTNGPLLWIYCPMLEIIADVQHTCSTCVHWHVPSSHRMCAYMCLLGLRWETRVINNKGSWRIDFQPWSVAFSRSILIRLTVSKARAKQELYDKNCPFLCACGWRSEQNTNLREYFSSPQEPRLQREFDIAQQVCSKELNPYDGYKEKSKISPCCARSLTVIGLKLPKSSP